MAEEPSSSSSVPSPRRGQEFWAIVTLGVTALICFGLMAIGLALIFSRGAAPSINNSTVVNAAGPATAPALTPTGIRRPSEPSEQMAPALPGAKLGGLPAQGVQRKIAITRADPPSPPSPPTTDPRRVYFRVRSQPAGLFPSNDAPPMPVRYAPDMRFNVAAVYASPEPEKKDERFSYTPDVVFTESGTRGQSLDLQLTQPRKTAAVDGYRAPKGFQFFTAKLHVGNQGAQPVALKVDDLEVHDAEGVRYLANPELVVGVWPSPSLAPKASLDVEISFLVPEESPLKELAVQEAPGQTALVPLQAR
jgi:hypothetical protein